MNTNISTPWAVAAVVAVLVIVGVVIWRSQTPRAPVSTGRNYSAADQYRSSGQPPR
jgi:hypothetical protein